jgi:hypothetical protein
MEEILGPLYYIGRDTCETRSAKNQTPGRGRSPMCQSHALIVILGSSISYACQKRKRNIDKLSQ